MTVCLHEDVWSLPWADAWYPPPRPARAPAPTPAAVSPECLADAVARIGGGMGLQDCAADGSEQ